ncbi:MULTISPECIES: aminodeoxychorismate/anthranilate synthase component II [Haloferax]|uniref:anthranilate synthase n=1 Tax=Haloferax marinum TaxID=2666143 RepID=A0A6A8G4D5_9EURY|nr:MULTISPECIES: aminodeoxychorismate/anthranilate synthase component II [Haloferax]KAB1197063.1 aminodeoxychorismate/anthranilate synthase component II [Haloferax sp. CBA1150]MRW96090.1 anthranilate/aminodeoxychorismate synthase component II [Haloferax marinum]
MTQILVVDNYDSFAYNLVQYVGEFADEVVVYRNDAVTTEDIRNIDPDGIVVSPGPGTPDDAGVSVPVFRDLDSPTLGVCLGHQSLCAALGSHVGHAPEVVHGKPSVIEHDGNGIFAGLPDRIEVGRYHSLAVELDDIPDELVVTASTVGADDGDTTGDETNTDADEPQVVMGVRHREKPHIGVQFHPESILTESGKDIVRNFVALAAGEGPAMEAWTARNPETDQ